MKMAPEARGYVLEDLGHRSGKYLGIIKKCGIVGRGVSLEEDLEGFSLLHCCFLKM